MPVHDFPTTVVGSKRRHGLYGIGGRLLTVVPVAHFYRDATVSYGVILCKIELTTLATL